MVQTISFCDFQNAFRDMNRNDNFTYEGKKALFDYMEEYEESTEETVELDIIALCCEYTEYSDMDDFRGVYGDEYETIEDIQEATSVITTDTDCFIIQDF